MRPKHWIKNGLVFFAPLLTFKLNIEIWSGAFISFLVFCLVSSSIYLLNDTIDYFADKSHPKKRFRPIASDKLSRKNALFISFLLLFISLFTSYAINFLLMVVVFLYAFIQILYCLKFKRMPLLDIYCIAAGFLLRSISGGIAAGLFLSPWFILSVGLLALFLALEKRKAELRVYEITGILTRGVLDSYTMPLLLRLESIVSTGSFITYSLWASGPVLQGASTSWMLLTVPIVLFGIFRYQLLSDPCLKKNNEELDSENPVNILFNDIGMLFIVVFWFFSTLIISILNS